MSASVPAAGSPTHPAGRRVRRKMSLWRLEWLRLVRTRRLLALVSVYLFFGVTGPLSAYYLPELFELLDAEGEVKIEFPPQGPADGIAQFVGNATQLGLLVVALVAAAALAFDTRREMAVFLRTRVSSVREIVGPAFVVSAAAAVGAYLLGAAIAWYETVVLLGGLPVGRMLAGIAYGALFSVFTVAVVAAVASMVRGVLATAGVSLALLIGLAILGSLGSLGRVGALNRWLPTTLSGALTPLVRDAAVTDYLPAAGAAVVLTGALLWFAIVNGSRREL